MKHNGVLHRSLPAVHQPEQLVMLSNPDDAGMWTGNWDGRTDGPRNWLTYAEFEQLRDRAECFSSLMASQSSLDTWRGSLSRRRVGRSARAPGIGRILSGSGRRLRDRPAIHDGRGPRRDAFRHH